MNSKPSEFPVTTCEFALPRNASSANIGGTPLKLPKAEPRRIVLIGDTGCRMKKADNAWQACIDQNEWPFRSIADAAAAMAPDLVLHVGDYHYRENACPPEVPGCQASPWGYGWDTWQADLFEPAAKLLAAAPWVVARGNHEECRRAGQGWFRFLDPRPFEEVRSCNDAANDNNANFTAPYAVPLANDLQLIMFDSAISGNRPLDPAKPRDAYAFKQYLEQFQTVDALANKPGVSSIFLNHHPVLGYSVYDDRGVQGGSAALQSVMKTLHPLAYYPASVRLALHGHVHLFEAITFSSSHPATILSGMGGDELSTILPDPFPLNIAPAEGVTLDNITHSNQFGFVVMDKQESTWKIGAYDV
ncbi:MAG: metallophosphoesterase, partial [Casimicrobium sp.]